jgi:UPF0755 protein
MRSIGRWLGGLLVLAILAVALAALWGYVRITRPGPLEHASAVVILRHAGVDAISRHLAEAGVIDDRDVFALTVQILGKRRALRAGEYEFPAHASVREAIDVLVYAKPVVRRLTVAEGLTSAQAVDEIARAEGLEGTLKDKPAEGSLLPETYNYTWGDGRDEMVQRMQRAMREALAAAWRDRAAGLWLKSPEEAVILASIVERETGKPEERPRIAGVFLNRLRDHMRLQSDPTVIYALTQGKGPLGRPLAHADLDTQSSYNTYVTDGLPPGPIANPGKASLLAVLHPAETSELYFVADGTGGHVFAKTLAEHNKNIAHVRVIQPPSGAPKAD